MLIYLTGKMFFICSLCRDNILTMIKQEPGIKWLFLDLNSYFANVEQQENPALRGKPVAVVPMDTPHTCAIAASYEAKAYGVTTGTIIRDARQMCPALRCVLARHDVYVAYHHKIVDEVVKHTPINKTWSIDELSSRLPPGKRSVEAAIRIAQAIKTGIRNNVGEAVKCSIGFAPNSLLAKIAGDMRKPDGLTILQQEDLPGPLLDLKLMDLPGIGFNMEKRLRRAGVYSVDDLWRISPKHARKIWGSVQGERFWYLLHGYDLEDREENTSMVGHSRVLDPDLRAPEKARLMARKLLMKAAARLRKKGFFAQKMSLSVRTRDGVKSGHTVCVNATQDPFELLQHLDDSWHIIVPPLEIYAAQLSERLLIKKVSVILHDLLPKHLVTDDLFLSQNHETRHHNESLARALESLQQRYKKDVVSLGIPPKTAAGYVGTKIAFSRVPNIEEFWSS